MGQLSVLSLSNLEQDMSIIIYVLSTENVEQVRIIISVISSVFLKPEVNQNIQMILTIS